MDFSLTELRQVFEEVLIEQRRKLAPSSVKEDTASIRRGMRGVASDVGLQQALTQILQSGQTSQDSVLSSINSVTDFLQRQSVFDWLGMRFPFEDSPADITISANTTWTDSEGFKRANILTINAGVTLTVARSPFFILCNELVFGSTTAIISGNGPNGRASYGAGAPTNWSNYARGALVSQDNSGGGTNAVWGEGGAGGIMLFVLARTIRGAAGIVRSNGGTGTGANTGGPVTDAATAAQGALTDNQSDGTPGLTEVRLLLGTGGGASSYTGAGAEGGNGSTSVGGDESYAKGGSGIGGGGGYTSITATHATGSQANRTLGPIQLLFLAQLGCLGGGGGGAFCDNTGGLGKGAGGGGGVVCVWAYDLQVTPTLQANGGLNSDGAASGAAGRTLLLPL